MAPTAGRGACLSLVQLFYVIGSFLSGVSLNIVTNQAPENWRNAVLSQFSVAGLAIICWFFIPESARWHAAKGREAEAKKILAKVNAKVSGYDVDQEYTRMRMELENVEISKSIKGGGSYLDLFRGQNFVRVHTIASVLTVFANLCS